MKLLICTQVVDVDDPVLGFFHRWIIEFSKRCETVHVICLREGRHELPENVFVHSLGKEGGRSKLKYISRFYRYIRQYRNEYDSVFVHMNSEYLILGGVLWKMWRKPAGLWYVHWATSARLRVAVLLASAIFTAREDSMRIKTPKKKVLGHGIDTDAFKPAIAPAKRDSILFLSRLDPVKRADLFVRALEELHEQNVQFSADIVGEPSDPRSVYAHDLRNLAAPLCLEGKLAMQGAVTHEKARDLFASHAIFCKLSPSGQFDKVLLEAMACGALVVSTDPSLEGIVPPALFSNDDSDAALARALRAALEQSADERRKIAERNRAYVVEKHSLSHLITAILRELS